MNKTLIIVDFQKDFINGSLAVPGAEKAEVAIVNYINEHSKEINDIIFTVDWHTPNHCSFKKNGGEWPVHCVQFSEGAGISDKLINACIENNIPFQIFKKGTDDNVEEYGAFNYLNIKYGPATKFSFVNQKQDSSVDIKTNNFIICGLAGDYCVKETILNLINHKEYNKTLTIFKDGIAFIDDRQKLNELYI